MATSSLAPSLRPSVLDPQSSVLCILVTAGPTREYFDTVRFISNPSTGKQGYEIAEAAAQRGHQVVLVSGPVDLPEPAGVRVVRVTTAAEMSEACKKEFAHCHVAIMTAAVSDYRPDSRLSQKLSKTLEKMPVILEPTEDICAALGQNKGSRVVIGFAMDDYLSTENAERKLREKNCDIIVQNSPSNIGADRISAQFLLAKGGWQPPFSGTKQELAHLLLSVLENHLQQKK